MGDFNKSQASAPKSEKKKIMMAGGLGAVLVGMGLFHFLKPGPQTADAAGPSQSADLLMPAQTPEEARAALSDDPTSKLLLKTKNSDAALANVPNNPFLMANVWRTNLSKGDGHTHSQVVTHANSGETLQISDFKLTGIFRQGQKLYAIINGEIVTTGGIAGSGRVTEIKLDHVTLQHAQSPNGPHLVLTINPTLK